MQRRSRVRVTGVGLLLAAGIVVAGCSGGGPAVFHAAGTPHAARGYSRTLGQTLPTPLPHFRFTGRRTGGCLEGNVTLRLLEFSWPRTFCLVKGARLALTLAAPGAFGHWSMPQLTGGAVRSAGVVRAGQQVDEVLDAIRPGTASLTSAATRPEGSEGTIAIRIRVVPR